MTITAPAPPAASAPADSFASPTRLVLRRGVALTPADDPRVALVSTPAGQWQLPVGQERVCRVLATLTRPHSSAELVASLGGSNYQETIALQLALARLQSVGALDVVVVDDEAAEPEQVMARLTTEGTLPVRPPSGRAVGPLELSRYAVLLPTEGGVRIESGATHLRVEVRADLVAALLTGALADPGDGALAAVTSLLAAAGVLVAAGSQDGRHDRQWSAADLWFHRRTTESRSMDRYGGTYPLGPDAAPEPFDPPRHDLAYVALPVPDLDDRRRTDAPLAEVVESRRSHRQFADTAPSLAEVSEVLYRSARARHTAVVDRGMVAVDRPYPSGGAIHELDLYVVANDIAGLDRGLWRYDPVGHGLDLVTPAGRDVDRLTEDARSTVQMPAPPPVVLLLVARFGRMMWKYESIGYALILKHVGVLMQTIYLNATAMGLGSCALGGASALSFEQASGMPQREAGIVGVMVVGHPVAAAEADRADPWGRS